MSWDIFLCSSLSILCHLDHSSLQFCLIWGSGLHSSSLPLTLGAKCFGFFSCTPFCNSCRSQLSFARHQLLRDYFECSTKSWCSLWCSLGLFLPVSSSPWALLVSQLLLWLSLPFKELLLSSEHSPGALASLLKAAHLYCMLLLVAAPRAQEWG